MAALPARAQMGLYGGTYSYFGAPGYYGVAYGYPAYGFPRTYTVFSSPYGAGYGYGYPPYGILGGRFGSGLWRPGFISPGYTYGGSYYWSFPVPYGSLNPLSGPPVGYYAPAFGPPSFAGW
ncbi:MAG: hypothetical protein IRY99_16315 [Isosphaeraceae bacterium]|nr:hypothetical protein [Isosphaeraceae bacterium]